MKIDFAGMTGGNNVRTLLRGIDATKCAKGSLVVRVEEVQLTAGNTIDFDLYPSWPMALKPVDSFRGSRVANVQLTIATVAPVLVTNDMVLADSAGPALDLVAKGTYGAAGAFDVTVSIGLLVWEE